MGKDKWLGLSGITTLVAATAQLFAPYVFLHSEFIDGLVTDDLAQLLRNVGCVHYVTGPMLLWSMKSKDESVKWATMFSQAFAFLAINASAFNLYFAAADQSAHANRLFSLALTSLWLVGSGFYLLTSSDPAVQTIGVKSDVHIYLARDFLITVIVGVFIMLFPVQTIRMTTTGTNKVTDLATYEVTGVALMLIGNSFISYLARDFQQHEDKLVVLYSKLLSVVLLLLSLILHHRHEPGFLTSIHGVAFLLLLLLWSSNAFLGIISKKNKNE